MSRAKLILIGGAAAAIVAGAAAMLFPKFGEPSGAARTGQADLLYARSTFARLLDRQAQGRTGLEPFGFGKAVVPGADDAVLLRENAGKCAGQGIYWLRSGAHVPLAITAPHRGSDRHTGTLASMLFMETGALAAAWNSAPRKPTRSCASGINLARAEHHLFNAFNLGFADRSSSGLIVQLHGFDGERRNSMAARDAGMIISNGTAEPTTRLLDLSDCLSLAFAPVPVLVYPGDTSELGALSNMQGQLLREAGFDGFAHIEISAELRADLIDNDARRGKLAQCLVEAAR